MTTYDILTFFLKLFILSNLVVAGTYVVSRLSHHKGNWIRSRPERCSECLTFPAEIGTKCSGCHSYRDHTGAF